MSLSRRSVLALGAGSLGALLGLWSCRQQTVAPHETAGTALTTTRTATQSTTQSRLATTSTAAQTEPVATTLAGSPNLGSEVFPDPLGRPLAQASDAPVIVVPRADWTAAPPDFAHIQPMKGINKITVHHSAGQMIADAWKPTAGELEHIREFHAGTRPGDRNWADIAYHFAVDRVGRVWQARPLAYQGAHVRGMNEHNLGIVLLGNFEAQSPTAAQLWSLGAFIGFLRPLYGVALDQVFTHGELGQTSCPGASLQAYMNRSRKSWAAAEGIAWSPRAG